MTTASSERNSCQEANGAPDLHEAAKLRAKPLRLTEPAVWSGVKIGVMRASNPQIDKFLALGVNAVTPAGQAGNDQAAIIRRLGRDRQRLPVLLR